MPDVSVSLDDADWEVIADDWWHTPPNLAPRRSSRIDREARQSKQRRRSEVAAGHSHHWPERLLLITKNVQGASICCGSCQEWCFKGGGGMLSCDVMKEGRVQVDLELNSDLVGVKMVLAMVNELERAVGFFATTDHTTGPWEIVILARRVSLLLGDAPPIVDLEDAWDKFTATVLDGHRIAPHGAAIFCPDMNADPPTADSITSILNLDLDLDPPRRKSHRFSRDVIDLTDSEQSVASRAPPATLKPMRSFLANGGDGTTSGDLPKFHLTRVPSSPSISYSSNSPHTSDGLHSESLYTRCSSLLPGGDLHKEDKDDEIVSESTPSEDANIPLFLVTSSDRQVKQHSRTREIIRLRSVALLRGRTKSLTSHGNGNPNTSIKNQRAGLNNATVKQLFQKGSDGWIRLADDAEHTALRTKDSSQAGHANGPRDTEPSESDDAILAQPAPKLTHDPRKKQSQDKHNKRTPVRSEGLTSPSVVVAPPSAASGGGPPPRGVVPPGHGHHRPPQIVQPAAPASVGTFTFPPPPYYAFPNHTVPAPQYSPMVAFGVPPQYQGCPSRGGYPHPSPPLVSSLPHQHQHQHAFPHPYMYQPQRAAYASAPVITGSAGIRHAQW